ncbi:hypothetical protein AMS59_15835 [Lysinibacillus sp. FJAT-14745]|uniref:ABC transporter permease n=1 Tax=Lysinibacillus sp. FJAT-14745 TaxID=1704289 RepID=UPI0006AB98F5|nr:ABC transporter permease [Lysinibacillus sp. FJAT-14745]KOP72400.1 hypothetical protein AMS59_15835 [Lysinibacillus sp. FJAT-14745]
MLSILYSEIVKLKRSLVFIVIPLAAIITAILSGFNAKDWHNALINNAVFWSILMGPAIASLFTGYVFANEYLDKTINNLLAYPYAAYKFFIGKMLAIFILITTSITMSFIFTIIFGLLTNIPGLNIEMVIKYIQFYVILIIMEFAFVPIAAFLTILSKNYILSTGFGVATSLIGGVLASFKLGHLFPSTAATMTLYSIAGKLGFSEHSLQISVPSISSLVFYFVIPLIVSLAYFRKMDVHSGS